MSLASGRIARMARALAGPLAVLVALAAAVLAADTDADRIRGVMRTMFDRPDAPLLVEPVIVVGDHAVAGWRQGDLGGRAVLRRENGAWAVFLCGGDALKDARELQNAGIPAGDARAIARELVAAEAGLPADVVARFGTLKTLVPVGAAPASSGGQSPDRSGREAHPPAGEPSR